jgi:hypothetical protein
MNDHSGDLLMSRRMPRRWHCDVNLVRRLIGQAVQLGRCSVA